MTLSAPAPTDTIAPGYASPADLQEVQAMVERAGTSFFWAMRMLEREKREAMYAIYAFCRDIDDIADEDGTPAEKRAALDAWRAEIDALYEGRPTRTISRALLAPKEHYKLPKAPFLDLIDGMQMDADGPIRAPSMTELELYCARVAGAVGQLSVCVFGVPGAEGQYTASRLGEALQLTNILRDLREDAEIGRLYLPAELLEAEGIEISEPQAVLKHPALPKVCAALAAKAEAAFADAEDAMADCDRKMMRPARIMMEVYRDSFESMKASGWETITRDRRNGGFGKLRRKARKLAIALRYGFFG